MSERSVRIMGLFGGLRSRVVQLHARRLTGRLGQGASGMLTGQTFYDIEHRAATQETHPPSKRL